MEGLIILAIALNAYMAPTWIAFLRKVPSPWSIAVINALLGWTLIGWAVALAWSVRSVPKPAATDAIVPTR